MSEPGSSRFATATRNGADSRFHRIVDSGPMLVVCYDSCGHFTYVNDLFERVGVRAIFDVGLKSSPGGERPPYDRVKFIATLRRVLACGETEYLELQLRRPHGESMLLRLTVAAERDASGRMNGAIVYGVDVSDLASYRDQIDSLAFRDVLTGLANRHSFWQQLQGALATRDREPGLVAVLMMDIDNFRAVNTCFGHPLGDSMLEKVANRLKSCVRGTATIARLGGDEFAVLLRAVRRTDDAEAVARKILAQFDAPFLLGKHEIASSVSVGISVAALEADRADEVLKHAEIAMYQAKQGGGCMFCHYAEPAGAGRTHEGS